MLFAKCGWNRSNGSEEDENVKTLQRNITNNFCTEKLTSAFGLGELENVSLISLINFSLANWLKQIQKIIKIG